MESLKIEGASTTTTDVKLESKSLFNKTLHEIGPLQKEQDTLQRQLEIKRNMFEEKME